LADEKSWELAENFGSVCAAHTGQWEQKAMGVIVSFHFSGVMLGIFAPQC
jgi:hypothetical protein